MNHKQIAFLVVMVVLVGAMVPAAWNIMPRELFRGYLVYLVFICAFWLFMALKTNMLL